MGACRNACPVGVTGLDRVEYRLVFALHLHDNFHRTLARVLVSRAHQTPDAAIKEIGEGDEILVLACLDYSTMKGLVILGAIAQVARGLVQPLVSVAYGVQLRLPT